MPGNNFLSIKLKNSSLLIDLDFQDLISFVWLLIFSSPKTTLICPSLDLPVLIERNLFLAFSWNMLHKMIHIVHWFVCFHLDDNDIYGLFWFVLRFGIFLSIEHVSIHYLRWEAIAAAFFLLEICLENHSRRERWSRFSILLSFRIYMREIFEWFNDSWGNTSRGKGLIWLKLISDRKKFQIQHH